MPHPQRPLTGAPRKEEEEEELNQGYPEGEGSFCLELWWRLLVGEFSSSYFAYAKAK